MKPYGPSERRFITTLIVGSVLVGGAFILGLLGVVK